MSLVKSTIYSLARPNTSGQSSMIAEDSADPTDTRFHINSYCVKDFEPIMQKYGEALSSKDQIFAALSASES